MGKNVEKAVQVTSQDGLHGTLIGLDNDAARRYLKLDNGQEYWIPNDLLIQQGDGSYLLAISRSELGRFDSVDRHDLHVGEQIFLPVVAEEAEIHKQSVITGRVKIRKTVSEREEIIDEPLLQEQVVIEHVAINKLLTEAASVRQEGNTLIIPVLEEVLVVEKRLMLKEEIRVTRQRTTAHSPQTVTLHQETVSIERQDVHEVE